LGSQWTKAGSFDRPELEPCIFIVPAQRIDVTSYSEVCLVTIGFNALPESLHPIEKRRMQGTFFNVPQNSINGQEKLICRLE
jgi:hypothetical protein